MIGYKVYQRYNEYKSTAFFYLNKEEAKEQCKFLDRDGTRDYRYRKVLNVKKQMGKHNESTLKVGALSCICYANKKYIYEIYERTKDSSKILNQMQTFANIINEFKEE